MGITLPKICAMGASKTGLVNTIGVTILNSDGTTKTARATADIYEIGGGCYGKDITFDDDWKGSIKWDTGGATPVYAVDEYDYTDVSNLALEATVSGVKERTDNLPNSPAPENEYDTVITALQTDLDNPDQYKADVSALALEATVSGIKEMEYGRWLIDENNNQMIFYGTDNTTEIARFNLKDKDGNASYVNVFERIKV